MAVQQIDQQQQQASKNNLSNQQVEKTTSKKKKARKDIHVILNGRVVDLTQWAKRHPGGRKVLFMFHERDATEQFEAYHSPEAFKTMEKMCKVSPTVEEFFAGRTIPPLPSQSEMGKDFAELRRKFETLGFFKPQIFDEVLKMALVFLPVFAGLAIMYQFGRTSFLANLIGAILHAFGCQQAGWTGHDYSHHSIFKSVWWNHFYAHLCGFVQGYNLYWWKARHNTHHVVTNEVHNDPDIKTAPLLTFFATKAKKLTFFQELQSYYYLPLVSLLDLYWKFESLEYVFSRLSTHWFGAGLLTIYWTLTYLIFAPLGLKTFLLCCAIKGLFTGLVVMATHYSEERLEADPKLTFAEQSARTSRNISGGLLIDIFSGCISRQISHHMFPMMPTSHLPKADEHVRAFLSKHGVEFKESSFFECTMRIIRALKVSDIWEVS